MRNLIYLLAVFLGCQYAQAGTDVTQSRYNPGRTGAYTQETQLHTGNVNPARFGLLGSYPVEGDIYAQPLYISDVLIPGKGNRNVLYIVTMQDVVYAFDADTVGSDSALLWQRDLRNPARGIGPVPVNRLAANRNIRRYMGIESTPVIDKSEQSLYFLARTLEKNEYVQKLYALDLATGQDKTESPVVISGSYQGHTFNPRFQHQRAGLALVSGQVVICWAADAIENTLPYYGWIMSYDAKTLKQTGIWTTTTSVYGGGIWASGRAPAVLENTDGTQDLIVFTGNAIKTSKGYDGQGNFAESMLRLRVDPSHPDNAIRLVDWFTPDNWPHLEKKDLDLGGSGPVLLPGSGYIVGGGKEGILYVVDPDNMGKLQKGNPKLIQSFRAVSKLHIMGGGVVWDRTDSGKPLTFYDWGESDKLKAFTFNKGRFDLSLTRAGKEYIGGHPGGILTLSSNGSQAGTGIVWAAGSNRDTAIRAIKQGILRAYDAEDITHLLWSSRMNTEDDALAFAKFTPPTVANGKVYLATFSNKVLVYGLLPENRAQKTYVELASGLNQQLLEVTGATRFAGSRPGLGLPSGMARQRWELGTLPNGDRTFRSAVNGLLIDSGSSSDQETETTHLWPRQDTANTASQAWHIIPSRQGYVNILSRATGKALTIIQNQDSSFVDTRPQNGDPAQDWKIIEQGDAGVTECDTSDLHLVSALPGNPLLSVTGKGLITLARPGAAAIQSWSLEAGANGGYKLYGGGESGEALTLRSGSVLYSPDDYSGDGQDWMFKPIPDAFETFSTLSTLPDNNILTTYTEKGLNQSVVTITPSLKNEREKWRVEDSNSIWCLN